MITTTEEVKKFFGPPEVKRPKLAGLVKDFRAEREVEALPGVGTLFVGSDLRLYRKTQGLLSVVAPCDPVEGSEPQFWVDSVDWKEFPPMGELKYLWETFLMKYDREVAFLVGKKWDGKGWLYYVPEQEGTAGSVDVANEKGQWRDLEAIKTEFLDRAMFVGTVHVHPGEWCKPSGVDLNWWQKKSASGLHMIFGRKGNYTITGTSSGCAVLLEEGNVGEAKSVEVELVRARGKKLEELLLVPPPPKPIENERVILGPWKGESRSYKDWKRREHGRWGKQKSASQEEVWGGDDDDLVAIELLAESNGAVLVPKGVGLFVMKLKDSVVVATAQQLVNLQRDCREMGIALPPAYGMRRYTKEVG